MSGVVLDVDGEYAAGSYDDVIDVGVAFPDRDGVQNRPPFRQLLQEPTYGGLPERPAVPSGPLLVERRDGERAATGERGGASCCSASRCSISA